MCAPLRKPGGAFVAPDEPKSVSGHSAHEAGTLYIGGIWASSDFRVPKLKIEKFGSNILDR